MAFGWGNVFGKIADWIPGREENLRNKKQELERKRDAILNKKTLSPSDSADLGRVLVQLHQVECKLQNR